MAMIRCAQCGSPMTDAEARSGHCPMCAAEVHLPDPEPERKPKSAAAPTSSGLDRAILFLVVGSVLFCFLPFGLIVYFSWPTRSEQKEERAEEKSTPQPEAKAKQKKETPGAKDPQANSEQKPLAKVEDDKKNPTAKEIPEKKTEPKDPSPEPKKTPGKEVAKIDPPKNVEAKPDPKVPDPKKVEPKRADLPRRWASLPYLSAEAIKIDGDLSDWKDLPSMPLAAIERGRPVRKPVQVPATQKAYLAYCSKGMLIAVDVVDTSGELENNGKPAKGMWPFWDNDGVEVFLDSMNLRPRQRGDEYIHQFFASPFGSPDDGGVHGFESRILKNKAGRIDWSIVSVGDGAIQRAGRRTASGWTLELLITNAALRQGMIKPGAVFGFELQIDTGTNIFYQWANDNPLNQVSTNPSTWGEILFAGADATIDITAKDLKPLVKLTPGEPFVVRVHDADVNTDPTRRERVSVTVMTRAGRRVVSLEETGPDSGVFQGLLPTRATPAAAKDNDLELAPDETVTVEYIEPLRADGGRNVTVRTSLRCR